MLYLHITTVTTHMSDGFTHIPSHCKPGPGATIGGISPGRLATPKEGLGGERMLLVTCFSRVDCRKEDRVWSSCGCHVSCR